ncbi:uncharacterized protein N7473_009982 [Penicillium subrubescens]|uniref:uncharacterized protein n=1 Tax=Penicillium subrubescens TaxID=1316194 RepID=UPI002545B7A8|nr:uncharacterized protein N7473_009982 [Penicillium subrubescens]KAJ5883096.1 hypothetical protein N7473_009982 [Penicillium subrubescens]
MAETVMTQTSGVIIYLPDIAGDSLHKPIVPLDCENLFLYLELVYRARSTRTTVWNTWLLYACVTVGLYLGSYPRTNADFASWSRRLQILGTWIFSGNAVQNRYWQGIGAQMICSAVLFSPTLRLALSKEYLVWLGKASFPLYLLHGPLMRSILAWMLFIYPGTPQGFSESSSRNEQDSEKQRDMRGSEPGRPIPVLMLAPFFLILFIVVRLWQSTVDLWVEGAILRLEAFAMSSELTSKNNNKKGECHTCMHRLIG